MTRSHVFVCPCWFQRESITTGNIYTHFFRGFEQLHWFPFNTTATGASCHPYVMMSLNALTLGSGHTSAQRSFCGAKRDGCIAAPRVTRFSLLLNLRAHSGRAYSILAVFFVFFRHLVSWLMQSCSMFHGCRWETFYIFAYCGLVGHPHLTAKIYIVAPLPTSTK